MSLPLNLPNINLHGEQKKQIAYAAAAFGSALVAWGLNDSFAFTSDIHLGRTLLRARSLVKQYLKEGRTYADIWEESVRKYAKNVAMRFEGKDYTFEQLDKLANRVAHWLKKGRGLQQREVVALLMENRPEYVAVWIGVLKAGCVCALINHNLKGKPLYHSLSVSRSKLLITGIECTNKLSEVWDDLKAEGWTCFIQGGEAPHLGASFDAELSGFSDKQPPRTYRDGVGFGDPALLVYTSGTTGLPKAATLKHLRAFAMGYLFTYIYKIRETDRIYCVLPLYHSSGGLVGVGMMILSGGTLVLRRKFSAREFWADCRAEKCTVIQYIGELCRYLLAAPPDPKDKDNCVRIAIGNGLRPDIWEQFQARFGINEIGEFYGSTEGNAALFNHCVGAKGRGAVGRTGPILYMGLQIKLVKFDVEKEEPVRGPDGFCIECGPDEPGELLGRILEDDPIRTFGGYYGNERATKQKIVENVFKKGDRYFRTGDLLKYDKKGYWYFVDRIGDTFRWKGENVSTTEVAEVLGSFPGIQEANVYGVEVPGGDGRACMAAIVCNDGLDFARLYKHCSRHLPSYAIPMFIRRLPQIEITGTFKHQKVTLRKQGCAPAECTTDGKLDPIWKLSEEEGTYKPFTQEDYEKWKAAGGVASESPKRKSKGPRAKL